MIFDTKEEMPKFTVTADEKDKAVAKLVGFCGSKRQARCKNGFLTAIGAQKRE